MRALRTALRTVPRPTVRGWLLLVATVGAWIASGFFAASILVVAAATGLGAVIVALLWAGLRRVSVQVTLSAPTASTGSDSDPRTVRLHVRTHVPGSTSVVRLLVPLTVVSACPPHSTRGIVPRLMVGVTDRGVEIELTPPHPDSVHIRDAVAQDRHVRRGIIVAGPTYIGVLDPLRLAVRWHAATPEARSSVLPEERRRAASRGAGSLAGHELDDPLLLREWRPGDALSRVHWRTSARSGRLQVRDTRATPRHDTEVVIDGRMRPDPVILPHHGTASALGTSAALERAIEIAVGEVQTAARAGHSVTLTLLTNADDSDTDGKASDTSDAERLTLSHGTPAQAGYALATLVATPNGARTLDAAELPAPAQIAMQRSRPQHIPMHAQPDAAALASSGGRLAITAVATLVLLVLGMRSWEPLFASDAWLVLGMSIAGPAWAAALALRSVVPRRWVAAVGAGIVTVIGVAVATLLTGSDPDAWWNSSLVNHTLVAIQTGAPPMSVDPRISLVIGSVLGVAGGLAAVVWAFGSTLGVLPALMLLAVPETVLGTAPTGWQAATTGFLLLTVLLPLPVARQRRSMDERTRSGWQWSRHRMASVGARSVAVAAVVALGVVAPAAVGTPSLRTIGLDQAFVSPLQGGTQGVLATLGSDLRRGATTALFEHTDTGAEGAYLALSALDDFTGSVWRPNSQRPGAVSIANRPDVSAAPSWIGSVVSTQIEVSGLASSWLPLPEGVRNVEAPAGNTVRALLPLSQWRWIPDTNSAHSAGDTLTQRGQRYAATGIMLRDSDRLQGILDRAFGYDPSAGEFNAGPSLSASERARYLALPSNVPTSFAQLADRISSADSPAAWGRAAVNYFTSGAFTYSETAPVEEGFDGSGVVAIEKFLQVRSGYCVHYAGAMAMLARAHGIPARIMVGYRPGTLQSNADSRRTYVVTNRDLHAWPQLFVDNVGWVSFEPTPGMGATSADSAAASASASPSPSQSAAPSSEAPTPSATPSPEPSADAADTDTDTESAQTPRPWGTTVLVAAGWAAAGLVALLLVVILGSRITLGVRGKMRMRRIRSGPDAAAWAWLAVRDAALDAGLVSPNDRHQSVRKQAAAMSSAVLTAFSAEQQAALGRVVDAFEAERYGVGSHGTDSDNAQNSTDLSEDVRRLTRTLRRAGHMPLRTRLAHVVAPPSLYLR